MQPKSANRRGARRRLEAKARALAPLLIAWFRQNARDLPWRRTRDPYAVWISEIMLQQTQVKTVIPYWRRWMRELPDLDSLAGARPDRVLKLWEGLGYYTRAHNLQKAARQIVELHAGAFPTHFDDVLALPGVGRYTAGAICSIAFNQPTPILDGNVTRVLARVFAVAGDPRRKEVRRKLWDRAADLVFAANAKQARPASARNCSDLNQALMELGAVICASRQPKCGLCPVRPRCVAFEQGRTDELPHRGRRIPATERHFAAFVIQQNGRVLVRQRPGGVVNGRLWEFPNVELDGRRRVDRQVAESLLGARPARLTQLLQVRHHITRYRVTTNAFRAEFPGALPRLRNGRWCSAVQLRRLAFPSAHRSILEFLEVFPGKPTTLGSPRHPNRHRHPAQR